MGFSVKISIYLSIYLSVYLSIYLLSLSALELYCQLEGQMERRQYYEALKTLEQLEHTMLPQISGSVGQLVRLLSVCLSVCSFCHTPSARHVLMFCRFSFAEMMREQIPTTRKAIEDLSRSEMTVCFEHWAELLPIASRSNTVHWCIYYTCYMMKPYIKGSSCALFWQMHWITHSCLIWKRITHCLFYNALL